MKKKILYIAAILICLSIISGGTLAYYSVSEVAQNVITSGGVEISLIEEQLVDGVVVPYPNQPIKIMPDTKVSKIVSVQSKKQSAWIRVNYTVTVYDAEGDEMKIPDEELEKVIIIQPDSTNWTQKDGWCYYNTAVASGEKTTPVFEEVVFSGPDMDNKYQLCTVLIDVEAQAVQQENNGNYAVEAFGWPDSEGGR